MALLQAPLTALHSAETTYPSDAIMSLDELAGDWMEVNTLRNFPSVNNFWGALKTHPNLTTFLYATFPPYANGGDNWRPCGTLMKLVCISYETSEECVGFKKGDYMVEDNGLITISGLLLAGATAAVDGGEKAGASEAL